MQHTWSYRSILILQWSILWSRFYFPDIVLHDRVVLFYHWIHPNFVLNDIRKARGFFNLNYQFLVSIWLSTLPLLGSKSSNKILCVPQCLSYFYASSTTGGGRLNQFFLLTLLFRLLRSIHISSLWGNIGTSHCTCPRCMLSCLSFLSPLLLLD